MTSRLFLRMGENVKQSVRLTDISPLDYLLSRSRHSINVGDKENHSGNALICDLFIENLVENFKDGIINDSISIEKQYTNHIDCIKAGCHVIRTFTDWFPSPFHSSWINNDKQKLQNIINSIGNTSIKAIENEIKPHNKNKNSDIFSSAVNLFKRDIPMWRAGVVGSMFYESPEIVHNLNEKALLSKHLVNLYFSLYRHVRNAKLVVIDDYRQYLDYLTPNVDILWLNVPLNRLKTIFSIAKDYKSSEDIWISVTMNDRDELNLLFGSLLPQYDWKNFENKVSEARQIESNKIVNQVDEMRHELMQTSQTSINSIATHDPPSGLIVNGYNIESMNHQLACVQAFCEIAGSIEYGVNVVSQQANNLLSPKQFGGANEAEINWYENEGDIIRKMCKFWMNNGVSVMGCSSLNPGMKVMKHQIQSWNSS